MKVAYINKLGPVSYRVRQCGASLLEGIAYLGIAAIVILGAVSLLASAFGNAQANRSTEETVALRTAARKLFTGQSYPADMTTALVAAKAVPGTMNVNTTASTVANAFGGAVTIAGVTGGGSFTITYASVPQDVCINMLSGASGWISIAQGSTSVTTNPITAANATAICSAASNTVVFTAA